MNETGLEDALRKLMLDSMQGNQLAYQELLLEVSKLTRKYLTNRKSKLGPERIEDLVQEVLMAIHLKKSSYRQDLPFMPWLFTIARHKLIDEIRTETRRSRFSYPIEETPNPFDLENSFQDEQEVESLLSGIKEKQKEVLIMAKVKKIPLKEIAVEMKMSLPAVKVTVHRTIQALRQKVLGKGEQ